VSQDAIVAVVVVLSPYVVAFVIQDVVVAVAIVFMSQDVVVAVVVVSFNITTSALFVRIGF